MMLAAAVARVDKGPKAHARDVARALGRDVAEQVGHDALGKIVSLDLVRDRETLQLRHQSPMSADHPPHQTIMAKMVEPALLAVALACRVDERQIARLVERRRARVLRKIQRLQRHGDSFGKTDADEAARRDRVAVADETNGLFGADDLPALHRLRARPRCLDNGVEHHLSPNVAAERRVPATRPGFVRMPSARNCATTIPQ